MLSDKAHVVTTFYGFPQSSCEFARETDNSSHDLKHTSDVASAQASSVCLSICDVQRILDLPDAWGVAGQFLGHLLQMESRNRSSEHRNTLADITNDVRRKWVLHTIGDDDKAEIARVVELGIPPPRSLPTVVLRPPRQPAPR